jgi:hypothetical protein
MRSRPAPFAVVAADSVLDALASRTCSRCLARWSRFGVLLSPFGLRGALYGDGDGAAQVVQKSDVPS